MDVKLIEVQILLLFPQIWSRKKAMSGSILIMGSWASHMGGLFPNKSQGAVGKWNQIHSCQIPTVTSWYSLDAFIRRS